MATIAEVVDYTNSWRASNGIAEGTELTQEQILRFASDLQTKIGEIPVKSPTAPNANIIPYNGKLGDVPAWKFAESASKSSNGEFIYISDTPAGKLLNSKAFENAVLNALGGDDVLTDNIMTGSVDINGMRTPYGVGDVLSVNDFVSRQAMLANAKDNVIIITENITADSVLAQTELPALLELPKVTAINGVPNEKLFDFKNSLTKVGYSDEKATDIVRQSISVQSHAELAGVKYARDKAGKIIWTDAAVKLANGKNGSIPPEAVSIGTVVNLMGPLTSKGMNTLFPELQTALKQVKEFKSQTLAHISEKDFKNHEIKDNKHTIHSELSPGTETLTGKDIQDRINTKVKDLTELVNSPERADTLLKIEKEKIFQKPESEKTKTVADDLQKKISETFEKVDWNQAKPDHPSQAPKLDTELYRDLHKLSGIDFEKAAKLWDEKVPFGYAKPTFVDRNWHLQNERLRQVTAQTNDIQKTVIKQKEQGGGMEID